MADMHTPLKPCPFCGDATNLDVSSQNVHWVVCEECGAEGPYTASPELAVAAWNRRAPSQDAETIKALREALTSAADTLEGLSYIHDGNPSDAYADVPPVDYARRMLFEARQMAKAARSEARAALAGSAS